MDWVLRLFQSGRFEMEQWLSFYGYVGLFLVLFVLPGFILAKCFNRNSLDAICLSAPLSTFLYGSIVVLYSFAGFFCNALTVCGGCLLIASLIYLFKRISNSKGRLEDGHSDCHTYEALLSVVLFGCIVGSWVYLRPLGSPATSTMTYDNVFHYGTVTSFLKSGIWSPLNVSSYLDNSSLASQLGARSGYYPAAWHLLVALLCSSTGCSVAVGANAVNFAVAAAVYPLSVYYLCRRLFQADEMSAVFSALVSIFSTCMPWGLLDYWPLYPNLFSMTLMPVGIGLFLDFCRASEMKERCSSGVLFLCSISAFFFAQPNSAFSVAAYLIPYMIYLLSKLAKHVLIKHSIRMNDGLLIAAISIVVGLAWLSITKLPFLQGVVQFYWAPIFGKRETLSHILNLSLFGIGKQPELALLAIVGLLLLLRRENTRWIAFSTLFIAAIYFVACTEQNTILKHVAAGFWYTDPYRVGALLSFSVVPPIGFALSECFRYLYKALLSNRNSVISRAGLTSPFLVAACFLVLVMAGYSGRVDTTNEMSSNLAGLKSGLNQDMYSDDERGFARQAAELIDPNSLVLNMPYDGSLFAYSLDGLPCVYRDMSGYGGADEGSSSVLLRNSLAEVGSNQEVAETLRKLNVKYLLFLHRNADINLASFPDYVESQWTGVNEVTDDTPGFKVILSEGDMRLYEIDLG